MTRVGNLETWPAMPATHRAVLREVLVHGALPRAELAGRLGLSKPTLTRVTRSLVASGFLREGETELRGGLGRPSELLYLIPESRRFVGIKLTGDHLYAVVTDLSAAIISTYDEPIPDRDVAAVVEQIRASVARFHNEVGALTAIGVALAGTIERATGEAIVRESSFLGWTHVPLTALISAATGLPTQIDNDVQALTAAEHWFGAGAGQQNMAVITVGVGIGCGLVINDRLVDGAHGAPGLVSHIIVDSGGPYCDRGHRGCASSYLTSSAIANSVPRGEDGDGSYASAVTQARAGRPSALHAFAAAGYALGTIIGWVANIVDPSKLILTGDGLAVYELAEEDIWKGIEASREDRFATLDLDVQPFDFNAWARGGAALAIRTVVDL